MQTCHKEMSFTNLGGIYIYPMAIDALDERRKDKMSARGKTHRQRQSHVQSSSTKRSRTLRDESIESESPLNSHACGRVDAGSPLESFPILYLWPSQCRGHGSSQFLHGWEMTYTIWCGCVFSVENISQASASSQEFHNEWKGRNDLCRWMIKLCSPVASNALLSDFYHFPYFSFLLFCLPPRLSKKPSGYNVASHIGLKWEKKECYIGVSGLVPVNCNLLIWHFDYIYIGSVNLINVYLPERDEICFLCIRKSSFWFSSRLLWIH